MTVKTAASLVPLLKETHRTETAWLETLTRHYPRADKWVWYKTKDRVDAGRGDKWDVQMAGNEEINAAHTAYLTAQHAFYLARDGAAGVLGRLTN